MKRLVHAPILLLLTLFILCPYAFAEPVVGTYATISDNVVSIGQLAIIKLEPHDDLSLSVIISDGTNTFKYSGQNLGSAIGFQPQRSGEHSLSIRTIDGAVLETLYFFVGELQNTSIAPLEEVMPDTRNETPAEQNASTEESLDVVDTVDEPVVLPTRTRIIETDRQTYELGETVNITALTEETTGLHLNIVYENEVLRFLGDMQVRTPFQPKKIGAYRVVVSGSDGAAIDSLVFVVQRTANVTIDAPDTVENSSGVWEPYDITEEFQKTSQRFKVRNARQRIRNGTISVVQNGANIKGSMIEMQKLQPRGAPDVEFSPEESKVQRIKTTGLRSQFDIGFDEFLDQPTDLPFGKAAINNTWTNLYAIDPTAMDVDSITVTVTATGTELFTCKDWDFAQRSCLGAWVKIRDVTPGENYTITLDPADPGFGETIPVPTDGWTKTTPSPADTVSVRVCSDEDCASTSTNFQPGDTVYVWVNSTNTQIRNDSTSQIDVYEGGDTTPVATYSYTFCVGTAPNGFFSHCRMNFTIPIEWNGWYFLDSDQHRTAAGGDYMLFRTPIVVGTEPSSGDSLRFYVDEAMTRETEMFGAGQRVYINWSIGTQGAANNTTSVVRIKNFHYNSQANTGLTTIAAASIKWLNSTGPYLFNFTMPGSLNAGGGWYFLEPNVRENSTENIPSGNIVHGRMILYQNNTQPTATEATTNSPFGAPVSVGQTIAWNASFDDADEVDRHAMYVCSTDSMSWVLACSDYITNSTCIPGGCTWGAATQIKVNYTTSGTFTVPDGVTVIQVEAIGAGGAGGGRGTSTGQGGGGGGGAMARSFVVVTPGDSFNVNVGDGPVGGTGNGLAGGVSNITNASGAIVLAMGGCGGQSTTTGGCSGNATGSIGQTIISGGTGGNAPAGTAGGGGGGAGNNTAGGNAAGGAPGTGGTIYGGRGGNGSAVTNGNGQAGLVYGGGGSGARRTSGNRVGGTGADGIVIITYMPFSCTGTPRNGCTAQTICKNETWVVGKNLTCETKANATMNFTNQHYSFVCDPRNCSSYPVNYSVFNDSEAPQVALVTPINPSTAGNHTNTFNFIPTDNYGFANCSLYTNITTWSAVAHNYTIENDTNNYITYTFPRDGDFLWNVQCTDYAGNRNSSPLNFTLSVAGPPIINLRAPANNSFSSSLLTNFTYNVTYSGSVSNCSLLINDTAVMSDGSVALSSTKNFTYTADGDGLYLWNVECTAQDGTITQGDGIYNATFPRYLTIDSQAPQVQLISPSNGATTSASTVEFVYTTNDSAANANCTLYVDDASVETRSSLVNNENQSIPYILENGLHFWYVTCYDLAANSVTSSTYTVNVSANTTGGFVFYETNLRPGNGTNYTATASINLSTSVDGRENSIARGVSGSSLYQMANALSSQFQSNGILINPSTTVNFSGYFSAQQANQGYITWSFYKRSSTTDTLICEAGNDFTGGRQITATAKTAYTNTCTTPASNTRLYGNESIKLIVKVYNNNAARRTYTHFFDNTTTFVSFNFTRLGFMYANLTVPAINVTAGINDTFNVTCVYNCSGGSCIDTQMYLQRNISSSWENMPLAGGAIIINATDTNPHSLGNVQIPGGSTMFIVKANQTGANLLRCFAISNFSNSSQSSSVKVTVTSNASPTIQLISPANNAFSNSQNIEFRYIPSSVKDIMNCSLRINNVINATNTSITKDVQNVFNISGVSEGIYRWNITCYDSSGVNGTSATHLLTLDQGPPNITLNAPANDTNFTTNSIRFNWTATDSVATTMSCNLTIDGIVNASGISSPNGTATTRLVSGLSVGPHYWNISCNDTAGNGNTSRTYQFNITNLLPSPTQLAPADSSWNASNPIVFLYNISAQDEPVYNRSRNFSSMIVYRSASLNGVNFPKWRNWTGQSWSAEGELPTAGSPVQWVRIASSPFYQRPWEKVVVTVSTDGNLDAYVWNGSTWSVTNNIGSVGTTSDDDRSFDVAYETATGRAILVYSINSANTAQDFAYNIWNGTAWEGQVTVDDTAYGADIRYDYMQLAANPSDSSKELAMAFIQATDSDAGVWIWNGSTWGDRADITTALSIATEEDIGIAYEQRKYGIVAVAGNSSSITYIYYNRSSWNQTGSFDINAAANGLTNYLSIKADPSSDQIMLLGIDAGSDLSTIRWNNYQWTGNLTHDTGVDTNGQRVADFAWEQNGGRGLLVWGTTNGSLSYKNFTGTTFSSTSTLSTVEVNTHTWIGLRTVPNPATTDVKVLGAFQSATSTQLGSIIWRGGAPIVSQSAFSASQGTATFESYDIRPDRFFPQAGGNPYAVLSSCNLYINGVLNQTNATQIYREYTNNFTVSIGDDGIYRWYVNCSDTDGNFNATNNRTLYIDRTAPQINLTNPVNNSNFTTQMLNFSFNVTDNMASTMTCNITLDGLVNVSGISATNRSNTTRSISGINDNTHFWNVTCIDLAGNANTSQTYMFNTSAPPVVTLRSPSNNNFSNGSPLILIYNVSENSVVENCSLYFDEAYNMSNASAIINNNLNNFTLSDVTEGLHTWYVTCLDDGALTGNSTTYNVTIDRTAPQVSLNAPANATIVRSSVVPVNWTVLDNLDSSLTCNVTRKGPDGTDKTKVNIASANDTNTSITYTGLADGQHFWNVTCIDDARNMNESVTWYFNVSSPPSVTLVSPSTNHFNNTGNLTLTYVPYQSSGIDNCTLLINGVENETNTTIANNANNYFNITDFDEGTYTWRVNCSDYSGGYQNSTIFNFTIDKTKPSIALNAPQNASLQSNNSIIFNYTPTDNRLNSMLCNLTVNGTVYSANQAVINGTNQSSTVVLRGGNRTYEWNVTCRDAAMNYNTSETRTFNISAPPRVTLVSPANNAVTAVNINFTYFAQDPFGLSNCSLIFDGQVVNSTTSVVNNSNNNLSHSGIATGTHYWTVECNDTDGDTYAPPTQVISSDALGPTIYLNAPDHLASFDIGNVTFNWTAIDDYSSNSTCNVTLNGVNRTGNLSLNNTPTANQVRLIRDGDSYWNVTCIDAVGNWNISETRQFSVAQVPLITLSGPVDGNLTNNTVVNFTFRPYDNDGFTNCSVIIEGTTIPNGSAVINNATNNITALIGTGRYNWSVLCYDNGTYLLQNSSVNRSLTINLLYPNVTLNSPDDGYVTNFSHLIFNWTANETFDGNLSCRVTINGSVRAQGINSPSGVPTSTNITWLNDSYQVWNVTCSDPSGNYNTSETRSFTVTAPPQITLSNPTNNLRTNNQTVNFTFTPSDNSGIITACTLVLNGVDYTRTGITNGTLTNITVTGLQNGTYNWSVNCTDLFGNVGNSSGRTLLIDTNPPEITLNAPPNGSMETTNVTFNWTAIDSGTVIVCNLTLDGSVNVSNIIGTSGTPFIRTIPNITQGPHSWNATCIDDLGQVNTSVTYNFSVVPPDLVLNDSQRIVFNNTNPNENDTINISANVSNLGGYPANNANISFFDGDPALGGAYIGSRLATIPPNGSTNVSVLWNITPGFHSIFVIADISDEIYEYLETNNNASRNFSLLRVRVHEPLNATTTNSATPSINFSIENSTGGEYTYTIYVDGVRNGQNGTINDNESINLTLSTLAEGVRRIIVQGNDSSRYKNSTALTIIVDLTAPSPAILTRNGTYFSENPFNVTIRINDTLDSDINYTLFVNDTINTTGNVTNATATNVSLTSFTNGSYSLIVQGMDNAGNYGNSTPVTIFVDSVAPSITLNSPPDAASFSTRNIPLNFTPEDNLDPILMCNVTTDGANIASNINVSSGSVNVTTTPSLAEGTHLWNVTCWDGNNAAQQVNNKNTSETRSFNIYIPPVITLLTPLNNTLSSSDTQAFVFNVTDETGLTNCSLLFNGIVMDTLTTGQLTLNATNNFTISDINNSVNWSVICFDNTSGTALGTSSTYNLTVDSTPPSITITTPDGTWFNTGPNITIYALDNYPATMNVTIFIDGIANVNSTAQNATLKNISTVGVTNGSHTVIAMATDLAGNAFNSSQITIYVDTVRPNVTLLFPSNTTILLERNTSLNFTASDNIATSLACNLTLDNIVVQQYNLSNESVANYSATNIASGPHYWNATCVDNASNRFTSETWVFTIAYPDFAITGGNITFSNSSPVENQTVEVNATIFNIDYLNYTDNITAQFYRGDPQAGGVQIGENITIQGLNASQNVTITTNITTQIGLNQIYVVVDPPTNTGGFVTESNESNNKASASVWVGLFEVFAGSQAGQLHIADSAVTAAFTWNQTETTGSNVFVADSDSTITFTSLVAIGRNTTNGTSVGANDFVEIDTKLNSSALNDSVNLSFTQSGAPKGTINITAFKRPITFVPVINSTNSSTFITGILWDASDGGSFYAGTQDIVFVTVMNQSQTGYYGLYDYEIAVPAKLRDYVAGGGTVTFYTELR